MNKAYIQKLEYNKIIEQLEKNCITYIGKDLALSLVPSFEKTEVEKMLNETNEAVSILYKASSAPIQEIENITEYLKTLESGGTLSLKGILDLTKILNIANNLKIYFSQDFINKEDYPLLANLFDVLYTNKDILEKISKTILDENTISDDASSKLNTIRRNLRKQESNIKTALNAVLQKNAKYIQENIVTIRNDRYVIPVKEEYRSQIKGLVHDISSTGATVFIEPLSIFELNNEINNLKIEEKLEIEKIIRDLSNLFIPYTEQLAINSRTIGLLDFVFAKAKLSKDLKSICPKINDDKYFNLKNVKHPLLEQSKAVPINVYAGNNKFSCLIITGPNTGGKTVCLKTVGLIHLMACSGLNIPADEGSSIYIFDNIFADIGDDQSIADSLSTFSSHMLNIVDIIKNATANSLILVDELGSGTDPLEGANLAISILEHFKNLGAITIATTHYQELKKYAITNDGFENASVEFEIETLSPTYKLLIGIPGKSNAFEISKKLGLDEKIINRASTLLTSKDVEFETVLKNIYDNKIEIEKEKNIIDKDLKEIEQLKKNLSKQDEEKTKKANDIINNAKQDARRILLDAKEEVNEVLRKVNETSSSKELNNIRNDINDKLKETTPVVNAETIKKLQESFKGKSTSNLNKPNTKSSVSYNISKTRSINSEINVIGENVLDATMLIDKFLDDAAMSKLPTVRIVHGKGTGKLRAGIHEFLKNNPHVKSYRMGTFGEGEMGVTIVELK
ncbi:MAG: endonuclease MutS2 [Clostridia bacterium]|nr:endonuclease MutS2 [Clostridia bacterium]